MFCFFYIGEYCECVHIRIINAIFFQSSFVEILLIHMNSYILQTAKYGAIVNTLDIVNDVAL